MMNLVGTPAVVFDADASPVEYSTLVATESPVIFTFRRSSGTISSVEDAGGSPANPLIYHDGPTPTTLDKVMIYDSLLGTMVEYTVDYVQAGSFTVLADWEPRFATDWLYFYNSTTASNVYLEVRLKVNGVYGTFTSRFSPNTNGLVTADISSILKSYVSGLKNGNYLNVSDAEIYQSGTFELEYRERYDGDANEWTVEPNDWYYIYAIRSKEQGSNLVEYWDLAWVNQFEQPTWWIGTPFDLQFWWNPKYTDLSINRKHYDAGNVLLSETTTDLDNAQKGYLVSVRIDADTIEANCDHIAFDIVEP